MSLTCVIVEDQTMFLQMLHNMLEAMPQLKVAATARSKAEAIAACEEHLPDLLVLDLALPDGEGIAVARKLSKLKPSSRTIILSGEANTFVCPADLQSHVHAVLDKMQAFDSLAEEVNSLLPRARTTAGSARRGDVREILTPREYEIFRLIGRGTDTFRDPHVAHLGRFGDGDARQDGMQREFPVEHGSVRSGAHGSVGDWRP